MQVFNASKEWESSTKERFLYAYMTLNNTQLEKEV